MNKRWLLVVGMCILPLALGHSGGDMDVFVRIASVDSGGYEFTCETNPASDTVRDWFIRAEFENSEQEEASFRDVPANETLSYSFDNDTFYHIGCLVVENGEVKGRGDLHIDLRNNDWNPELEGVSGENLTGTYQCTADANGTPSWSVLNAETGAVTDLGTGNPLTHTVDEPGLYDYSCEVDGTTRTRPVEYFTDHATYFGNMTGVPAGVTHSWNLSDTDDSQTDNTNDTNKTDNQTDDNVTDGNQTDGNMTGLFAKKRNGLTVTYTCNPENSSDDLSVDWNYGDGTGENDIGSSTTHTYAANGTYYVQCFAWDNTNAEYTSLQKYFTVTSTTTDDNLTDENVTDENVTDGDQTDDNGTDGTNNTGDMTGLFATERNGLTVTYMCNPENSSDDLSVDWNYGDGNGANDVDATTTHSYSDEGTYFVQCFAWDNVNAEYTSLQAYFDVTSSSTLSAPQYIEPSEGLTGVAPDYFHLNVEQPSYEVLSSDWEVWNENGTERVWAAENNTNLVKYHTHTPDGFFTDENRSRLDYSTSYQVRVRFNTASGSSPWSELRTFTTKAAPTLNASDPTWTVPEGFGVERFATGFDVPVHVAQAPPIYDDLPENNRPFLYVTELYGTVKVVYRDGSREVYAEDILNFDPFGSITGGGQMGTVSLYVDDAGDLFVGTVYQEGEDFYNKVIKYSSSSDGSGYTNSTVILDGVPSGPSHQIQQITKGTDGKLYVNFGEALDPANAQNDSNFAGMIMRMQPDGSNPEIYAKGFRNPFGADWRPGYEQLFVTDNAPDTDDRLVRVEQGENYGWGLDDNMQTFLNKRIATLGVSPVDMDFNNGTFPNLTGRLYVAVGGAIYQEGPVENGKHVKEFTLDEQGDVTGERTFLKYSGDGYGTPIGLEFADGGLYVTDIYGEPGFVGLGETEGNIYRVSEGNSTVCDSCTTGPFRAGISVKPWYPKDTGDGIAYVFECNGIDGTEPYEYKFDLGTGAFSTGSNSIYIEYPYGDVNRSLQCNAEDATGSVASASITVNPNDFISG